MATAEYRRLWQPLENRFNSNISIIRNRQRAAALQLPGAEAEVAKAKVEVERVINDARHSAQELENRLNKMLSDQSASVESVKSEKAEVELLKKQVSDARTLNEIRKEQVEVLKSKNSGNYHTSYLGLWVPLKEHTRVLLFAISIFLLLIGIVGTVFLVLSRKSPEYASRFASGGFHASVRRK
jgi:hypothetical protein